MPLVEVTDLGIGYDGEVVAQNINFTMDQGDYLCIVGENGSGKSTLVKTLLGLQKPIEGNITLEENGIGYLPQQTIVQKDFPASVWEVVLSGNLSRIGGRPFYKKNEKDRTKRNMERLGIWELRKKCYRNLSGGQQQRVLLARALCASENLLFLDEPVTGLDPKVTAEFYELIKQINKEGVTIIMISHDVYTIGDYASHILHVGKDRVFFGTTEEYQNSDMAKTLGFSDQERRED